MWVFVKETAGFILIDFMQDRQLLLWQVGLIANVKLHFWWLIMINHDFQIPIERGDPNFSKKKKKKKKKKSNFLENFFSPKKSFFCYDYDSGH